MNNLTPNIIFPPLPVMYPQTLLGVWGSIATFVQLTPPACRGATVSVA